MAKVYLLAGTLLTFPATVRIGATGTIADTQIDWYESIQNDGGECIEYSYVKDENTFHVYLEKSTGRLWYDDERPQ